MRHFLSTALLCSAALLFACDGKPAGGGSAGGAAAPILVGQVVSLTGTRASYGVCTNQGTQLALEEINAAGGVLGRPLAIKNENNQSKIGEPKACIEKLIHSDHVVAVLGEFSSSASLEMAPVAQEAQIPMVSSGSTNPQVTQKGDYIFRVCFIDPFQGAVISKYSLEKGWKKVAVLTESTSDYSVGLTEAFRRHFTANGGVVVAERTYAKDDKDFSGVLSALKGAQPDAVFIPGYYGEVALIARQAKQAGLKAQLLGGDGWSSNSLIEVAGAAIEGGCFCNHLITDDFRAKFKAKYGEEPDALAALGYDSLKVLADALRRAGSTDAAKVRDALAQTKNFPGATGSITLDQDRNASKPAAIMTVKGGKFEQFTVVQP